MPTNYTITINSSSAHQYFNNSVRLNNSSNSKIEVILLILLSLQIA